MALWHPGKRQGMYPFGKNFPGPLYSVAFAVSLNGSTETTSNSAMYLVKYTVKLNQLMLYCLTILYALLRGVKMKCFFKWNEEGSVQNLD